VGANGLAIVHRDASSLLPPMLQGIERIIDGFGGAIGRLF